MKSWGIWLTALIRGCKLEPLTLSISGTTAPIFYIMCYAFEHTVYKYCDEKNKTTLHGKEGKYLTDYKIEDIWTK